jgi:hypothetical protein
MSVGAPDALCMATSDATLAIAKGVLFVAMHKVTGVLTDMK